MGSTFSDLRLHTGCLLPLGPLDCYVKLDPFSGHVAWCYVLLWRSLTEFLHSQAMCHGLWSQWTRFAELFGFSITSNLSDRCSFVVSFPTGPNAEPPPLPCEYWCTMMHMKTSFGQDPMVKTCPRNGHLFWCLLAWRSRCFPLCLWLLDPRVPPPFSSLSMQSESLDINAWTNAVAWDIDFGVM